MRCARSVVDECLIHSEVKRCARDTDERGLATIPLPLYLLVDGLAYSPRTVSSYESIVFAFGCGRRASVGIYSFYCVVFCFFFFFRSLLFCLLFGASRVRCQQQRCSVRPRQQQLSHKEDA